MTTSQQLRPGGGASSGHESMSSVEASRASRSHTPVFSSASTMSDGCGQQPLTSYAQYDPATCSWRTSQLSFEIPGLSEPSLETFTPSGSMRNGQLYERPTSVHPTTVNGSTCWPTPRASMGTHGIAWVRAETGDHRSQLEDYLAWRWLKDGNPRVPGLQVNPEWNDWLMGFPTNHSASSVEETQSSQQSPSTSDD